MFLLFADLRGAPEHAKPRLLEEPRLEQLSTDRRLVLGQDHRGVWREPGDPELVRVQEPRLVRILILPQQMLSIFS